MGWKRSSRERVLPAHGSEAERSAIAAISALRFELLRSAVAYGVYSALAEGSDLLLQEWLAWMRWMDDFFARALAVDGGRAPDVAEVEGWPNALTYVLEHPEESGEGDQFDDQELRDWAKVQFERVAVRARPVELLDAEPLAEVNGVPAREGTRLLAAVQDSLVLASLEAPELRGQRAEAVEILADLVAARDEGVWEYVLVGLEARKSEPITVSNERLKTRGGEIFKLIGPVLGTAARVYGELMIDGRELSESEAAIAQEQLVAITTCLRGIHADSDVIEAMAAKGRRRFRDGDLRPTIAVMRMMQRGYGLALSEDPERRAQTMSVWELGPFLRPLLDFWGSR